MEYELIVGYIILLLVSFPVRVTSVYVHKWKSNGS